MGFKISYIFNIVGRLVITIVLTQSLSKGNFLDKGISGALIPELS